MIYIADSFWYHEVSGIVRSDVSTSKDIENFIRKDFETGVNVERPNMHVYSVDFADSRYETLFKIKYSEYVRNDLYCR